MGEVELIYWDGRPLGTIIFEGPFDKPAQVLYQVRNNSNDRLMFKIRCSDTAALKVHPVYFILVAHETKYLRFECSFAEKRPTPGQDYVFALCYTKARLHLTEEKDVKGEWNNIRGFDSCVYVCQFREASPHNPWPDPTRVASNEPPPGNF